MKLFRNRFSRDPRIQKQRPTDRFRSVAGKVLFLSILSLSAPLITSCSRDEPKKVQIHGSEFEKLLEQGHPTSKKGEPVSYNRSMKNQFRQLKNKTNEEITTIVFKLTLKYRRNKAHFHPKLIWDIEYAMENYKTKYGAYPSEKEIEELFLYLVKGDKSREKIGKKFKATAFDLKIRRFDSTIKSLLTELKSHTNESFVYKVLTDIENTKNLHFVRESILSKLLDIMKCKKPPSTKVLWEFYKYITSKKGNPEKIAKKIKCLNASQIEEIRLSLKKKKKELVVPVSKPLEKDNKDVCGALLGDFMLAFFVFIGAMKLFGGGKRRRSDPPPSNPEERSETG